MNRGKLKRALLVLAAVVLVIQLGPVDRVNPPVETEIPAPAPVRAILRRACYDCHSNETIWPWYGHVAPVSWLLQRDVREGRREVNFSAWNRSDAARRARKWKEIADQVREGEMPPWFYTAVHPGARLSDADRQAIDAWVTQSARAEKEKP